MCFDIYFLLCLLFASAVLLPRSASSTPLVASQNATTAPNSADDYVEEVLNNDFDTSLSDEMRALVRAAVQRLSSALKSVRNSLDGVKSDLKSGATRQASMMRKMQSNVNGIAARLSAVQSEQRQAKAEMKKALSNTKSISNDVKRLKTGQAVQNRVAKRLQSDVRSVRSEQAKAASARKRLVSDLKKLQSGQNEAKMLLSSVKFVCPKPWTKTSGMCLLAFGQFMPRKAAQKKCHDAGGDLVWMENSEELADITKFAVAQHLTKIYYFVGLNIAKSKITWITGPLGNTFSKFDQRSSDAKNACIFGGSSYLLGVADHAHCKPLCRRF